MENSNPYFANQKKSFSPKKNTKIIIIILLIIISFFISLIIGISNTNQLKNSEPKVTNQNSKPDYLSKNVNFKLFWEVWDLIKDKYVEEDVNEVEMFYGAQMGLVASLRDPYSLFLPPEEASDFQEELQGKFEGIGAEIALKNNQLTIVAPLPDSPAEKAGLKAGDKILKIDNTETFGISLDEAVFLIRGDQGTEVILKVEHKDHNIEDITIIRDQIHYKSVNYSIKENNIGYIEINHFNEDTDQLFEEAVQDLLAQKVNGYILDLRNNPGGFLTSAIKVASYWIEDGVIVKEKSRNKDKNQSYSANGRALLKDQKTIVLINGGSASGSEIVAGALQDYNLATLVGEKTFGKGSVQDLNELSDGSSLKLTIAKWLTPLDRTIDEEGIQPDIEVELTEDDYNNDRDPQLDKAIEMLK